MKTSILTALVLFGSSALAANQGDNSKINERDRASTEVTADQQKENPRDLAITQQIRKDLIADKNLSTYAQNVKVITVNGQVTLKGPVRSAKEQAEVLKYARAAAGSENVVNAMSVVTE